ncbi:hypothetical protein G6F66_014052 [Rhizopus arrhizus]|nr:hypothetical protein G6F66_014052 [Rhizopus arrhizus]
MTRSQALRRLEDWFAARGWRSLPFQRAMWRHYLAGESGVLHTPTGSGKTRLLNALAQAGAQTLDLEQLASHRGSLLGALPGIAQPSQKRFDTLLAARLREFDASQAVYVEAESRKIGSIALPPALLQAMHRGACVEVISCAKPRTG